MPDVRPWYGTSVRRYLAWWVVLLVGCQGASSSGSGSEARPAASAAAAAPVASSALAIATDGPVDPSSPEGKVLAFAREAQALAVCDTRPGEAVCQEPGRIAWLTEHVDWQLHAATQLVLALEGAAPKVQKTVAEGSIGDLETAREAGAVLANTGKVGRRMIYSGKPCALTAADDEDSKIARRWLDARPQASLPAAVVGRLEPVLARRAAIKKLHALHCGSRRIVIGWGEGAAAPLFPMW